MSARFLRGPIASTSRCLSTEANVSFRQRLAEGPDLDEFISGKDTVLLGKSKA
jgi:hypothetical protein